MFSTEFFPGLSGSPDGAHRTPPTCCPVPQEGTGSPQVLVRGLKWPQRVRPQGRWHWGEPWPQGPAGTLWDSWESVGSAGIPWDLWTPYGTQSTQSAHGHPTGFPNTGESLCCPWGQQTPQRDYMLHMGPAGITGYPMAPESNHGAPGHPMGSADTCGSLCYPWGQQAPYGTTHHPQGQQAPHGSTHYPWGQQALHRIPGHFMGPKCTSGAPEHPTESMDTCGSLGYLQDQRTSYGVPRYPMGAEPLELRNTLWNTEIPVGPCAIHGTLQHP